MDNAEKTKEHMRLFGEFLKIYPRKSYCESTKNVYEKLVFAERKVSGEQILCAARNYKEYCRIKEIEERFIYTVDNWIEKSVWVDYLPENYKKPKKFCEKKIKGTGFTNFEQRDYDFDELEEKLLRSL